MSIKYNSVRFSDITEQSNSNKQETTTTNKNYTTTFNGPIVTEIKTSFPNFDKKKIGNILDICVSHIANPLVFNNKNKRENLIKASFRTTLQSIICDDTCDNSIELEKSFQIKNNFTNLINQSTSYSAMLIFNKIMGELGIKSEGNELKLVDNKNDIRINENTNSFRFIMSISKPAIGNLTVYSAKKFLQNHLVETKNIQLPKRIVKQTSKKNMAGKLEPKNCGQQVYNSSIKAPFIKKIKINDNSIQPSKYKYVINVDCKTAVNIIDCNESIKRYEELSEDEKLFLSFFSKLFIFIPMSSHSFVEQPLMIFNTKFHEPIIFGNKNYNEKINYLLVMILEAIDNCSKFYDKFESIENEIVLEEKEEDSC